MDHFSALDYHSEFNGLSPKVRVQPSSQEAPLPPWSYPEIFSPLASSWENYLVEIHRPSIANIRYPLVNVHTTMENHY